MDKQLHRAILLAVQLDNYIQLDQPCADEFDSDTKSRISFLLSPHFNRPTLPKAEDPYPPDWSIHRPSLHKATVEFIRLSPFISPPIQPSQAEPPRPLGRKATRIRRQKSRTPTPEGPTTQTLEETTQPSVEPTDLELEEFSRSPTGVQPVPHVTREITGTGTIIQPDPPIAVPQDSSSLSSTSQSYINPITLLSDTIQPHARQPRRFIQRTCSVQRPALQRTQPEQQRTQPE